MLAETTDRFGWQRIRYDWQLAEIDYHTLETAALAAAIEPFLNSAVRARAGAAARQTAEATPMSLNVQQTLDVMLRLTP